MLRDFIKQLWKLELMFLFSGGLSLIIRRLSLISDKYFLFSWVKILKLSKESKYLQWSKWAGTALLLVGLSYFPKGGGTLKSSPDLISVGLILSS